MGTISALAVAVRVDKAGLIFQHDPCLNRLSGRLGNIYSTKLLNRRVPCEPQPMREMEVAGTVIAVDGVAGLFSTALEVFDYVESAAAFGATHEVL